MDTIDVLIDAVNRFEGAVLIISHDIYFLSRTAKVYWAIAGGNSMQYGCLYVVSIYMCSLGSPHMFCVCIT